MCRPHVTAVAGVGSGQHEHRIPPANFMRRTQLARGGRSMSMMAKPSSPIPRNIKETVASLRAAVQVMMENGTPSMNAMITPTPGAHGLPSWCDPWSKTSSVLAI